MVREVLDPVLPSSPRTPCLPASLFPLHYLVARFFNMDHLGVTNGDAMDVDRLPNANDDPHEQQQRDHDHATQAGPSRPSLPDGMQVVARRASSLPLHAPAYSVGCVYSVEMILHFKMNGPDDHHPEQPARIQRIQNTLVQNGLFDKMKHIPIRQVKKHEAMLVHSEDHWDKVIQFQCEP